MSARVVALVALVALLGCSRAAGPAIDRPAVAARTSMRIHDAWFDYLLQQGQYVSLLAGSPPDAPHPAGTMFALQMSARADSSEAVAEWDLATGNLLREVVLPVPIDASNSIMVRAGDHLHALLWNYERDFWLVRVRIGDGELRVEHAGRLGVVAPTGPSALASDGDLVFALFDGSLGPQQRAGDPRGYHGLTFDAAGHSIAERVLLPARRSLEGLLEESDSASEVDNAVVSNGHVYVLLSHFGAGYELIELSRKLAVERRLSIRGWQSLAGEPVLYRGPHDTLEVSNDLPEHPLLIRFTPDLKELSRTTRDVPRRAREFHEVHVGPLTIHTCWFHDRQLWLTWSPAPDACASIPKQGTHRAALTRDPDDPADDPP